MPTITDASSTVLTLDRFHGKPETGASALSTIKRQGVDGVSLRVEAKHPGTAYWESLTAVTTKAGVQTLYNTYLALQGTLISITDELGNTWSNVAVKRVMMIDSKAIGESTGFAVTNPVAILLCSWELQFTEVTS